MSQPQKKLGFRDKIKKMLEIDSPRERKKSIIDENNVKFILSGGSVHSELLVAEAIMDSKSDNNYGMPLPIICKWYNKTKTDEITEIEGITGAFYQPNADDINTFIIVEAQPILEDSEYQGQPLRKEIGPIVIDKQIQEEVQELLETGRFKIAAKLETMSDPTLSSLENEKRNENFKFPKQCTLLIDTDKVQIQVQDDERMNASCPLGQFYPSIKIIKRTNNVFELYLSQNQMYRVQAQSNTHRDVITVALRMFCGKKIISSSNLDENQEIQVHINENNQNLQDKERQNGCIDSNLKSDDKDSNESPTYNGNSQINNNINGIAHQNEIRSSRKHQTQAVESYEVFVKLNDLTKKTVELEQLRDDLKNQVQQLQDDNKSKQNKLEQLDLQVQELKQKLKVQQETSEQYRQKHSQYMNEKLFLTQELQVVQQEIEGKNKEIDSQKNEISLIKKQLESKKEVIDEEEHKSLQNTISDLVDRLNKQIQHNKIMEQQLVDSESKYNEVNSEKENLQNEVLHFKKKYECILQEKQIMIASQKSLDSPQPNKYQNNIKSQNSINYFNKKEDDSGSEKADNDTQNNLSGHNHMSQSTNIVSQFSQNFGLSPIVQLNKSQSQVITPQNIKPGIFSNRSSQVLGNGITINIKKPEVSNNNLQDIEVLKNQLSQKIEENHNQTKKIVQLETTLEKVTQAYTQSAKTVSSPTKQKQKESGNEQMLQKLVNNLTEIITDKDIVLESQKKINKELMQKIQELQQKQ